MSYCRFSSDSDAYIYQSTQGLDCCGCSIAPKKKLETPFIDMFGFEHEYEYETVVFDTAQEMLDHVALHRELGHKIPESVDERLRREFPDLNASTAETEEERLERIENNRAVMKRLRAKLKAGYKKSD